MKFILLIIITLLGSITIIAQQKEGSKIAKQPAVFKLSIADYNDRVYAIWRGQMLATLAALPAEHTVAAVKYVDAIAPRHTTLLLDDDWYYEMIAVRGFEKHGIGMTIEQLGEMWKEHQCGSWGSSAEARKLLEKGVKSPLSGHPLYNRYWFTIGPQFSADVYRALAPGMPDLAAKMAREYGHVNGYAEGTDGAVFVATAISLGFIENDPKTIVRKAASIIHKSSPYRQCLDMVIQLAGQGKNAKEVLDAVEDKYHIQYPATNNAVANGGIIAASLWFGEADFLKTLNLAARSLDFTDADCNAANAIGVIMAMKGSAAIPQKLNAQLGDRIKGEKMGPVTFKQPIDESVIELAKRTAIVGEKILMNAGAVKNGNTFEIPIHPIVTQPAELFSLADYAKAWNSSWELVGAGFEGPKGGTYLDKENNILITYPRDEVRRLNLNQTVNITTQKNLALEVGAEEGRPWELIIYIDDTKAITKVIDASEEKGRWQEVLVDLSAYQQQQVKIRMFQNVIIKGSNKLGGNAYWKTATIQ
jgi:hypothetical protein